MLTNLATHRRFQESLHAEIMQERNRPSYDIAQYISRRDMLLHYLSVRLRPAFCEFLVLHIERASGADIGRLSPGFCAPGMYRRREDNRKIPHPCVDTGRH